VIGPTYFSTLGIPRRRGFTPADALLPQGRRRQRGVAKKFNLGRDAVGKHISDQDSARR
jgi:hypothetical protein